MTIVKHLWFKAVQQRQKGFIWLLLRLLFKLLSLVYFIIIKLHFLFYKMGILKSFKLPAYIISVGNITVGGTGKTPFVIYLAETFSKNSKVGILSRGYGSQRNNVLDDESFPLPDNVVRIASPNRITGGIELIEKYGAKTIILDDGFQHLKLKRDINFIIIDATNPFGNGWVLPAGILREPISCLNRADIFVITHTDLVKREQLSALESKLGRYNKKIIKTIHKPQYLVLINQTPNKIVELSEIKNKNVWGFCGIGNPYQFHKTLESLCNMKSLSVFPDHYYYSTNDLSTIFNKAKDEKIEAFITTEKDALRLQNMGYKNNNSLPIPNPFGIKIPHEITLYYLKINIEVLDEEDIIKIMRQCAL